MTKLEQLEKDIHQELIVRARQDVLALTLLTKEDYEINWHHRLLSKKLNAFARGEIQYLMIFMPPRHGKSELVSRRFPAFLHGLYPDDEIMAVSYLDSLAMDMTVAVQDIIDSSIYKEIFPGVDILPPRSNYTQGIRNSSEHTIIGRKGRYRGQGVGGSFTGKGANWILIDDPIKGREIADSQAFRDRLWQFFKDDLYSRLETDLKTGKKGQILITQTRWHEDDLSGRLIEQMRKDPDAIQFEILELPAIRETMENPDDPRAIGEPLWERKYDLKQLNEIKASIGARGWGSLYQQHPTPDGGALFNESMFDFVDLPPYFDYTFITADTSYKEKQENDFTCFSCFGVISDQLFLIDVFHEQIKASDVEKRVEPFVKSFVNYGYRGTWIEPKGHGIYLNQAWQGKGFMIPSEIDIKEFYKDRRFDKVERANNVIPHLAHRKVLINKLLVKKEQFVNQALGFPKVKHDDFVDTLIDALKMVYGKQASIFDLL